MRIGYGKLGRSFSLNRAKMSTLGGDVDVLNLLERLALRYPKDEIVIVGRNSGENPQDVGLPANITNPWTGAWPRLQAELQRVGCVPSTSRTGRSIQLSLEAQVRGLPVFKEFAEEMSSDIDAWVCWVGQHGTSNWNIPRTDGSGDLTHPQDSFYLYAGHLIHAINVWRDKSDGQQHEVWLNPDPRNFYKGRDLKWPPYAMYGQYDYEYQTKHERYGDPRGPEEMGYKGHWEHSAWTVRTQCVYAGVELTAITDPDIYPMPDLDGRIPFGMIINENRRDCKDNRLEVVKEWVKSSLLLSAAPVYGSWSAASQAALGHVIRPLPHHEALDTMGTWRCTFTTPASGSGWATAKPWEAFLVGTICFFHPKYDTQNHILKGAPEWLRRWLRVESPAQLTERVVWMARNDEAYSQVAMAQREHLEGRFRADLIGGIIQNNIEEARDAGQAVSHL